MSICFEEARRVNLIDDHFIFFSFLFLLHICRVFHLLLIFSSSSCFSMTSDSTNPLIFLSENDLKKKERDGEVKERKSRFRSHFFFSLLLKQTGPEERGGERKEWKE